MTNDRMLPAELIILIFQLVLPDISNPTPSSGTGELSLDSSKAFANLHGTCRLFKSLVNAHDNKFFKPLVQRRWPRSFRKYISQNLDPLGGRTEGGDGYEGRWRKLYGKWHGIDVRIFSALGDPSHEHVFVVTEQVVEEDGFYMPQDFMSLLLSKPFPGPSLSQNFSTSSTLRFGDPFVLPQRSYLSRLELCRSLLRNYNWDRVLEIWDQAIKQKGRSGFVEIMIGFSMAGEIGDGEWLSDDIHPDTKDIEFETRSFLRELTSRFHSYLRDEGFDLKTTQVRSKDELFLICDQISQFLQAEKYGCSIRLPIQVDIGTRSLYRTIHPSSPNQHRSIPMICACIFDYLIQTLNLEYNGKRVEVEPIEFPNHILACLKLREDSEEEEMLDGEIRWRWKEIDEDEEFGNKEKDEVFVRRITQIQISKIRQISETVKEKVLTKDWKGSKIESRFYFSLIDLENPIKRVEDWSNFVEIPPERAMGSLTDLFGGWMDPPDDLQYIMFRQANNLMSTAFIQDQQRVVRAQHRIQPNSSIPHINSWNLFNPLLVTAIMAVLHTEFRGNEAMFGNLLAWLCQCLTKFWRSGRWIVKKWILKGGKEMEMRDDGWVYTQLREMCEELEKKSYCSLEEDVRFRMGDEPYYKVGQVFRHLKKQYVGIILSWDLTCLRDEIWKYANSISALSRGDKQPFYSVVADDSTLRYASEENIQLLSEIKKEDFLQLMKLDRRICNLAWRFDGWDSVEQRFIMNEACREVFPRD